MEVGITALIDQWPILRQTLYKVLTVAIVCLLSFCVGLIFTMPVSTLRQGLVLVVQQGKYLVTLVDNYAGGLPLVISCLVEVVMVSWVYGSARSASIGGGSLPWCTQIHQ